jgi:REP element-mobilizing transposase RayT
LAGDICHVVARGVDRQLIYRDDVDRRCFLRLLAARVTEHGWRCLSYCLMPNHYHLVVQLNEPTLSVGAQRLNGDYVRWFNARHAREGHFFERRFWSKRIVEDAHFVGLMRYVALNPVRANLCPSADRWRWSAHRALLGLEPPGFVDVAAAMRLLGEDFDRARLVYAGIVSEHAPLPLPRVDVRLAEIRAWIDPVAAVAYAHRNLGYGVREIAGALGCSPRTVKNRLRPGAMEKGV